MIRILAIIINTLLLVLIGAQASGILDMPYEWMGVALVVAAPIMALIALIQPRDPANETLLSLFWKKKKMEQKIAIDKISRNLEQDQR